MSTDWGIGCRDCAPPTRTESRGEHRSAYRDEPSTYKHPARRWHWTDDAGESAAYFTGEWDNCRNTKELQKLSDAAEEILALHAKIGDLLFLGQTDYADHTNQSGFGGFCHGLVEFMQKHKGHRLAPMSEYRLFEDER